MKSPVKTNELTPFKLPTKVSKKQNSTLSVNSNENPLIHKKMSKNIISLDSMSIEQILFDPNQHFIRELPYIMS